MSVFIFFRYSHNAGFPIWANSVMDLQILALCVGLIFGCLHWLSNLIVDYSFIYRLPYIVSLFVKGIILLAAAITIGRFFQYLELWGIKNHHITLWEIDAIGILYSDSFKLFLVYLIFVRISLAFVEQMGLLVGTRELLNIAIGKYHRPLYEQRLFMFLDMSNSTMIAEKLGDYRFSCLIQDCFKLLNEPVSNNGAEIYRYMGDGVFLHWQVERGIEEERCLHLYFEFNQILKWHSAHFKKKYGFVPEFKAAIHCGQVVTAVVGVQKREISFFSDVLNTLSRLQDQCSTLKQELIISSATALRLDKEQSEFDIQDLGQHKLKGKQHSTQLFGVTKKKKE
ncbi:adenylate/guanylate cyclase domain-containing protein [Parashewanella tropica]|uniref:adenylate/guanylate cyclase domain-containing protein n=1 Tax=Parashewanella tropica TaxID=2547970 RepID=UPI0014786CB1|nr:adenylate/guanylate cyclase domain-containing protein [Parashewanella tropica]